MRTLAGALRWPDDSNLDPIGNAMLSSVLTQLGLLITLLLAIRIILSPVLGPIKVDSGDDNGLSRNRAIRVIIFYPLAEEIVFRLGFLPYLFQAIAARWGANWLSVAWAWFLHWLLFVVLHLPLPNKRYLDAAIIGFVCGVVFIRMAGMPSSTTISLGTLFVLFAFHSVFNACRLVMNKPLGASLGMATLAGFVAMGMAYGVIVR